MPGPAGGDGASFERFSYTDDAGTRTYKLYVPAALARSAEAAMAPALIVQLHGCGGDADEEARWSRFTAAHAAMGARARVVPVLAVVGDLDREAPPANTEQVVQQHLANDDLVDDGADNASVATSPARTESRQAPAGHAYSVDTYEDAAGCVLAERWLVNGMAHAWSKGESDGSARDELFTDAAGPDVTTAAVDFFLSHPMPAAGNAHCHQV